MHSRKSGTIFTFMYAQIDSTIKEQVELMPNTNTNIIIATYDPRVKKENNIRQYTIKLDDNVEYDIINKQYSDTYIHNPTLLTLHKKAG